jgi:hypothetical protein
MQRANAGARVSSYSLRVVLKALKRLGSPF